MKPSDYMKRQNRRLELLRKSNDLRAMIYEYEAVLRELKHQEFLLHKQIEFEFQT